MILGIDPGTKRVGLAIADPETRFATPLHVVAAGAAPAAIVELVKDRGVRLVVVGRPLSLSGKPGAAVETYEQLIGTLRDSLPDNVEVVEFDERLTSVIAERELRAAGLSSKEARNKIDAQAARVMLQGYLDSSKSRA